MRLDTWKVAASRKAFSLASNAANLASSPAATVPATVPTFL